MLPGQAEPLKLYSKEKAAEQKFDLITGFVRAKAVEHPKRFPPPKLPPNFVPKKIQPSPAHEPGNICSSEDFILFQTLLHPLPVKAGSSKLHRICKT